VPVSTRYDVIVVGAGHAGCEAAHAAARLGLSTLLITLRRDRIGWMSCNPAIGGMAKGHLVREIDALGGLMGRVTDETGIQFRTLNRRRGPAVRGSRAQCDRRRYAEAMGRRLVALEHLTILEDLVESLIVEGADPRRIVGVQTEGGEEIACGALIVTTGTFLNGVAHVGRVQTECGREGDRASVGLAASLRALGLKLGRFKTGTTPRLDGRSIDHDALEVQPGEDPPRPFSGWTDPARFPALPQRVCHVTRTNARTHAVVRAHLGDSPLYSGIITGTGPRYCPSIEDKVQRFGDREGHTVYLEPDGLDTDEVYPGGISTSLPAEVQRDMLRTLAGLESVEILRPGYAIEYDFVVPTQLRADLSVKGVAGLYLAGQINGTSGYEEAAAQGLLAGLNAAAGLRTEPPVILGRDQAYLGVLVDDLTTAGTGEPYRMFTSRAEHRLSLREDNADLRLAEIGFSVGLLDELQIEAVRARRDRVEAECRRLEETRALEAAGPPRTLATVLRRPELDYAALASFDPAGGHRVSGLDAETVEVEVKYAGYIERTRRRLDRQAEFEALPIPDAFDFSTLPGLSNEVREKLDTHRPATVGQAGRISGVTPAAVEILAARLVRVQNACG
jgi:tRNA uridine 5-carboxymethylaminomethyl modification enzyme